MAEGERAPVWSHNAGGWLVRQRNRLRAIITHCQPERLAASTSLLMLTKSSQVSHPPPRTRTCRAMRCFFVSASAAARCAASSSAFSACCCAQRSSTLPCKRQRGRSIGVAQSVLHTALLQEAEGWQHRSGTSALHTALLQEAEGWQRQAKHAATAQPNQLGHSDPAGRLAPCRAKWQRPSHPPAPQIVASRATEPWGSIGKSPAALTPITAEPVLPAAPCPTPSGTVLQPDPAAAPLSLPHAKRHLSHDPNRELMPATRKGPSPGPASSSHGPAQALWPHPLDAQGSVQAVWRTHVAGSTPPSPGTAPHPFTRPPTCSSCRSSGIWLVATTSACMAPAVRSSSTAASSATVAGAPSNTCGNQHGHTRIGWGQTWYKRILLLFHCNEGVRSTGKHLASDAQ